MFVGFANAPALAQAADNALAGEWNLETGNFDGMLTDDCHIEGVITLEPTALPGGYTCSFVSEQICTLPGQSEPHTYFKVQQSCSAQRVGDGVAIHSEVEEILEFHSARGSLGYVADNFVLRITKRGAEMIGTQYDEFRQITARFWRDLDLTS